MVVDLRSNYDKENGMEISIGTSILHRQVLELTTQVKAKYVDVVLIGFGMFIGFCVILMHLTGMWPCQLLLATGNFVNIENFHNAKDPLTAFVYDMHYGLLSLLKCS